MTGHIANLNFDPHKDAIEGAPVDSWPRDQWDDNNKLRPGWVEHLPVVDDTFNPPHPPVRAATITNSAAVEPHTGFGIRLVAAAALIGVCAVLVLAVLGIAHLAGWRS